ncbi:ATP synthase F0 subunit B [bacterium]|nr:ATP synthase F0 subunit B [bacterium]
MFNFIIFAGIIAFLFIKLNVIGILNAGKESVAEDIEDSNNAKKESEENLKSIEDTLSHLSEEIDEIIKNSEDNANLVGEKIVSDANSVAENIKTNSLKLVENRAELLRNDLIQKASLVSVEIAKKQILEELERNKELHAKLIDESVEAINGVNL